MVSSTVRHAIAFSIEMAHLRPFSRLCRGRGEFCVVVVWVRSRGGAVPTPTLAPTPGPI